MSVVHEQPSRSKTEAVDIDILHRCIYRTFRESIGKMSHNGPPIQFPINLYIINFSLNGLNPGAFFYSIPEDAILELWPGRYKTMIVDGVEGKPSIRKAHALLVLTLFSQSDGASENNEKALAERTIVNVSERMKSEGYRSSVIISASADKLYRQVLDYSDNEWAWIECTIQC